MSKSVGLQFKDELRSMLIKHALIPFFVLNALLLFLFYFVFLTGSKKSAQQEIQRIAKEIKSALVQGEQCLDFFESSLDIQTYMKSKDYKGEVHKSFFERKRQLHIQPEIYLFNAQTELLFTTENYLEDRAKSLLNINYKLDLENPAGLQLFRFRKDGVHDAEAYLWRRLATGETLLLVYKDTAFISVLNSNSKVILSDKFLSILAENTSLFQSGFGKRLSFNEKMESYISYQNERYYLLKQPIEFGLEVLLFQSVEDLFSNLQIILFSCLIIFLIFILVIAMSAKQFADKKTKVIYEIVDFLREHKERGFDEPLLLSAEDELGIIADTYNEMIASMQSLMQRNIESSKETSKAKLKQLESEFNPHFLFNTLENIRYMIKLDPSIANDMILCMCNLLRYSISDSEDTVPLHVDLQHTLDFLKILQYRFSTSLEYSIEGELLQNNRSVPKLILQPIIENSVKYGMQKHNQLRLRIYAEENEDFFLLCIQDDAGGIEEDTLQKIQKNLELGNRSKHIGIANVHHRLQLMYGKSYGVSLEVLPNQGTIVQLKLPKE